ncbi:MAG: MerR family transcriptional regulator [Thermomicrobiales bacterium]
MTMQVLAKGVRSSGRDDADLESVSAGDRGRWLSIHDACRFLGVDQSTLRRWSDAGKVPVFRTPGGHRRYAEDDLRRLVGEGPRRQERSRLSRQNLTDRSLSGYEEEYLRSARERRWFKAYSPATQEEHRRLGRRLVDLAIRYAAAPPETVDRGSYLAEGQQIGEHYGRSGAIAGLSAGETVEAFLFFRYPVVRAVMGMIEEEGLAAKRAARVFIEIGYFMDQVLIATVRGQENYGAFVGASRAMSEAQGTISDV